MKLIKQRAKGECGPACLAMVLGIELDQAVVESEQASGVRCTERGCSGVDMIAVLNAHGLRDARESLEWDTIEPAILTVASLNFPGLLHFIVWDGERFLDSANSGHVYPDNAPSVPGADRYIGWASVVVWSPSTPAPLAAALARAEAAEMERNALRFQLAQLSETSFRPDPDALGELVRGVWYQCDDEAVGCDWAGEPEENRTLCRRIGDVLFAYGFAVSEGRACGAEAELEQERKYLRDERETSAILRERAETAENARDHHIARAEAAEAERERLSDLFETERAATREVITHSEQRAEEVEAARDHLATALETANMAASRLAAEGAEWREKCEAAEREPVLA